MPDKEIVLVDTSALVALGACGNCSLHPKAWEHWLPWKPLTTESIAKELEQMGLGSDKKAVVARRLSRVSWIARPLPDEDIYTIMDIRDGLARRGDGDRAHLGEASLFAKADALDAQILMMRDNDASEVAGRRGLSVVAPETVIRRSVPLGAMTCIEVDAALAKARGNGQTFQYQSGSEVCQPPCHTDVA